MFKYIYKRERKKSADNMMKIISIGNNQLGISSWHSRVGLILVTWPLNWVCDKLKDSAKVELAQRRQISLWKGISDSRLVIYLYTLGSKELYSHVDEAHFLRFPGTSLLDNLDILTATARRTEWRCPRVAERMRELDTESPVVWPAWCYSGKFKFIKKKKK